MAQSSLSSQNSVQYDYCNKFIKRCADEFQWKGLSEDVVMVIGCGDQLSCCKAIMTQFPEVKALIAVDKESTVFQTEHFSDRRIQFCVGDIRDGNSLKSYEGKMDKVVSMHTFHHILYKETAFRNVYRLLKPGGEAGFNFSVYSCMGEFLTALSEMPKYGAILEDTYATDLYSSQQGEQYYKELLKKIGFKFVRSFEEPIKIVYSSDKCFEDDFLAPLELALQISPEATETFKAEALELYERKFGRNEGKLSTYTVQLNLFEVKPMESSDSKSEETMVV